MNISYNWLKEYIDFDLSSEELKRRLTFAGIEVEKVEKLYENLKSVKVAKIVEREKHPNADKLSVCKVDDGENVWQVVCGAPNCDAGQFAVFAPVGTQIGEIKLKKAKLRGIESFGMLCAEDELGLSDDHAGIMILKDDSKIGQSLADHLKLSDTVYEVEITPNRPDLLGMIGIARDLSSLLTKKLNLPKVEIAETGDGIGNYLALKNEEPELCARYTARFVRNITVKESPDWLKKKLTAIGLRPINNIVDITNFVMMEYGHPLHAFDYDKISGKSIIVRKAKKNEEFSALDDNSYKLQDSDLVIADLEKPIALAGVIGGSNSHITETTTNIVIEAANFLYSSVRKTSGYHKIFTDSSYRFERNLSDVTPTEAGQRAAQLILKLAGGELHSGCLDSFPTSYTPQITSLRPSRVKRVLAIEITKDKIISYLTSLGLTFVKGKDDLLEFDIPHYRNDLSREIDLIEEIIRLHGYDKLPNVIKPAGIMNKDVFYMRRSIQDTLVKYGFSEVVNWSFGDPADLDKLNIAQDDNRRNLIKIKNPIGQSFSAMRSMLLPDVLKNAIHNINHGEKDFKLFEMNKVFFDNGSSLGTEELEVSGVITGQLYEMFWKESSKQVDFFDIKGAIEEILETVGLKKHTFKESNESYYQPALALDVYVGKKMGHFGKIDPKIAEKYDIEQPMFAFTLNVSAVANSKRFVIPNFTQIPKYPFIFRDTSFVISKEYQIIEIIREIKQTNSKVIKNVRLMDEYTGKNIEKGYRSLTFNVAFNSEIKTLTDEYVNNIMNKVIKNLKNKFSIKER